MANTGPDLAADVAGTRPEAGAASPWQNAAERDQDRGRKRSAILEAAVAMFNERGFHATSLDDIAARLGISKPVIYHHLGNKDQVLFHCVQRGIELLRGAVTVSEEGEHSGIERLRLFLRRYAEVIMSDFGRCVIRTDDSQLAPESRVRFRALKREIDGVLRERIAAAIADRSIAAGDVRLTAFTLAGALNWLAWWHDPAGPTAPEKIADSMVDTLLAGLASPVHT